MAADPQLTISTDQLSVTEGRELMLECAISRTPSPTITWTKDGDSLEDNSRISISTQEGSSTLIIASTRQEDSGVYQCEATNIANTTSLSTTVIVEIRKDSKC